MDNVDSAIRRPVAIGEKTLAASHENRVLVPQLNRRIKIEALTTEVAQSDDPRDVLECAIAPL